PAGGPGAWIGVHVDANLDPGCSGTGLTCQSALVAVACPSVSLCAAIDFAGNILETTAPATATPWTSVPALSPPGPLWGLACPTATLCAAVDGDGGRIVRWDPTVAAPPTLTRVPAPSFGIWCGSPTICVTSAKGANGDAQLLASGNAVAAAPVWTVNDFGAFSGVACPSFAWCVGSDEQGGVVVGATVTSLATQLAQQLL